MKFFLQYSDKLLIWITIGISLVFFLYFFFHGQQNLSYYDAIARLNTARKMIDSITPGIGQLGGIWLPFPQILLVPFIWNNFLWHSGFAGYIISGSAFVIGAVFLQKEVYLLTKSRKVALLIWFIFISNINILILQTMAMSEMFFLCFFILTIYFLTLWTQKHQLSDFLLTAFCVMILTLTRYEGDFVLVGVFLTVIVECFRVYKFRNREKIEGMLLLFLSVAGFGIFLWCIYSALFYKDPLFWLHAYSPPSTSALLNSSVIDHFYGNLHPTMLQSISIYSSVILWTNGIISVGLGILGLLMYLISPARRYISLFIVSAVLYFFLVLGYYKNLIPLIEFPLVYLTGSNVREWSVYADNNVRYGIVLLPCILLFSSFIANKNKVLFSIALTLVAGQAILSFTNPMLLQYTFYKSWRYPAIPEVPWFREHYDGGLVLIAASRHEDFIFQSGLPYKDFIYEGTRQYWTGALSQPSQYASWVIFDEKISGDDVTLGLTKEAINDLKKKYQLVYVFKGFRIYKLIQA
jgi:hypothetical protein